MTIAKNPTTSVSIQLTNPLHGSPTEMFKSPYKRDSKRQREITEFIAKDMMPLNQHVYILYIPCLQQGFELSKYFFGRAIVSF